ncbi:hypothetical protein LEP1GSC163_0814 [Leptospira santarosai str. CBC379]|nr:hypothetical protein [Leptospira santarosai]EKR93281.1 hypothetical protein LEP1GSC163_0814 [Leptospira santarosai str. CBC379]
MENTEQFHDQTKELLEEIQKSSKDWIQIFYDIEGLYSSRQQDFGEVTKRWKLYEPTHRMIEDALGIVYHKAIKKSARDPKALRSLRDFFLSPFEKLNPRYDLIAALGDPESAQIVFDAVEEEFNKEADDEIDSSCFNGLFELFSIPEYKERILNIVRTGFDRTIEAADDDLVNDTIFNHLGRLCVQLNDESSAEEVFKAFVFGGDPERHYEMNTVAAKLALYLTALNYQGPTDTIKDYVDYYSKSYGDDEFVVTAKYAYWWFQKNTAEALVFLNDPQKKESLGIVASLLADLNEKRALPVLQTRLKDLTNPVTMEVFKEAIHRLETQQDVPRNMDRMIWMFGFRTKSRSQNYLLKKLKTIIVLAR